MSTLLPLYDRVLVRPAKKDKTSASGLELVYRRDESPNTGVVVAVGPGRVVEGVRAPMSVAPGDEVIFEEARGRKISFAGEDLISMRDVDLAAVVES